METERSGWYKTTRHRWGRKRRDELGLNRMFRHDSAVLIISPSCPVLCHIRPGCHSGTMTETWASVWWHIWDLIIVPPPPPLILKNGITGTHLALKSVLEHACLGNGDGFQLHMQNCFQINVLVRRHTVQKNTLTLLLLSFTPFNTNHHSKNTHSSSHTLCSRRGSRFL